LHEFIEKESRVGRDGAVALVFLQQVEQEIAQCADLAHDGGRGFQGMKNSQTMAHPAGFCRLAL
jgi:hypothetical protein